MALLSKQLQTVGRVVTHSRVGLMAHSKPLPPILALPCTRAFRWDGRPDNVQGHSFLVGLNSKANPFFWALVGMSLLVFLDWGEIREKYGIRFPNLWVSHGLEAVTKDKGTVASDEIPSSLAGEIYDKYGEEGLKALVKAWEQQEDSSQEPSINAVIAVMQVQKEQLMKEAEKEKVFEKVDLHSAMLAAAKDRYTEEVAQQAKELGMMEEWEEEERQRKSGGGGGVAFGLKAEEAVGVEETEVTDLETSGQPVKEKIGFRDRKIIEYENRIRQYSTPDKVFRYFATFKLVDEKGNHEIMMTPLDFLRSISPGEKQPEHLGLDAFIHVSPAEVSTVAGKLDLDPDSVFYQLGAGGLISFSDYIFLLTVLSTSRRHFQIAFKMFDLNGDGTVDASEFGLVTDLMRSHSATGSRHRDHGATGSVKGINTGLNAYFFGEDLKGELTVERFLDFQRSLQEEILALEFKKKDEDGSGKIAEKDFADLLIAYAGFQPKKKARMLRRVRKAYDGEASEGVELKDYLNFYQVLYSINDIDTALTFYHVAGAPIDRKTMQHVARTVAHVELSDHLTDVVFTLFDNDGDGKLSNKEFVSVMKQRAMRGLEKPKDMGISRIFSSLLKCSADCKPAIIGGSKRTE